MPNFWDSIGLTNKNNGFDLQSFIKFYKENKNQDPNKMLQQLLSSGKVTEQQFEQAKSQANGILQMLQSMGILK